MISFAQRLRNSQYLVAGISADLGRIGSARVIVRGKAEMRQVTKSNIVLPVPHLRNLVKVPHVEIGETEVDVTIQTSISAVEVPVDHLGDELARHGNDEGIGDN